MLFFSPNSRNWVSLFSVTHSFAAHVHYYKRFHFNSEKRISFHFADSVDSLSQFQSSLPFNASISFISIYRTCIDQNVLFSRFISECLCITQFFSECRRTRESRIHIISHLIGVNHRPKPID